MFSTPINTPPDELLEKKELILAFWRSFKILPERDLWIMGAVLDGRAPTSIAENLGFSRTWVQLCFIKAQKKMRRHIEAQLIDKGLYALAANTERGIALHRFTGGSIRLTSDGRRWGIIYQNRLCWFKTRELALSYAHDLNELLLAGNYARSGAWLHAAVRRRGRPSVSEIKRINRKCQNTRSCSSGLVTR